MAQPRDAGMLGHFSVDRIGLFLDVDGTLIDIAARPDAVVVPQELLHALESLNAGLGGAVALISGRSIANLDGLFAPLRLRASGVHGAEFRFDPRAEVSNSNRDALPDALVAAVTRAASDFPGTLVENKRFSVAVHYRNASQYGSALAESLGRLVDTEPESGLRILPGHMVFEVKRANFDKGLAVSTFMRSPPFQGRQPIFIGDDITDQPGFDTAKAEGGFAFSVGHAYPGVSGSFPHPAAVRTWLSSLASTENRDG